MQIRLYIAQEPIGRLQVQRLLLQAEPVVFHNQLLIGYVLPANSRLIEWQNKKTIP